MRVALHPDGAPASGTGHVMRCRTLAAALEARGAETSFGNGLNSTKADWLVVDHYGLDERWEKQQRKHAEKILAIDDLADRRHDCDLLLDQNWFPDAAHRYDRLVPPRCRKLLGPRYALLRREFFEERKSLRKRTGKVHRILVSFGGLDAGNETSKAIALLKGRGIAVDVVVGAANPHEKSIARECKAAGFALHRQAENMAELMAGADLAVGAGGSTTWERCCLGLPTVQVAIAPNQEALSRALADAGMVIFSGNALSASALEQALTSPATLAKQSAGMMELVDGEGAARVAAAILVSEKTNLSLRNAKPEDSRLYFAWANDPEVRRQSFDPRPIDWAGHQDWFARRLEDALLLVAADEAGVPLGQVRFERKDGWRINYSVGAEFRGFGLGGTMLAMAITELRRRHPGARLVAEVKPDNAASRRVFETLGFARISATTFERTA